MDPKLVQMLGLALVGAALGWLSGRLPASGKGALALSLLPAAAFGLARVFC